MHTKWGKKLMSFFTFSYSISYKFHTGGLNMAICYFCKYSTNIDHRLQTIVCYFLFNLENQLSSDYLETHHSFFIGYSNKDFTKSLGLIYTTLLPMFEFYIVAVRI